jgi:nitronate monooxygenase
MNLFLPHKISAVAESKIALALETTAKFRLELGLPAPSLVPPYEEKFDSQIEAVISVRQKVLSFIFGVLPREYLREARSAGIFVMGSATTLLEAKVLEESGVDAIVAQGFEGGGHRAIFEATAQDSRLPLAELLSALKREVKIPVVAAGGIMTAADVRRTLERGADAVQMGTAFLTTREAGTSGPYRRSLLESANRKTKTTRAFSGRWARGLVNRFMEEMESHPEGILPFPAQNKFTRDLRSASVAQGLSDYLSLWCGTGELWTGSAGELIENLFK